jgi:Ca2+-binding RTX toxin-like protein
MAAVIVVAASMTAVAAANTVPPTRVDNLSVSYQINHLRPSACAGLSLTNLVTGSGTLTGTSGNDLILAGPGADSIDGLGGSDCIVGGAGDDALTGGDDSDICVGGDGSDTFSGCEGEIQ